MTPLKIRATGVETLNTAQTILVMSRLHSLHTDLTPGHRLYSLHWPSGGRKVSTYQDKIFIYLRLTCKRSFARISFNIYLSLRERETQRGGRKRYRIKIRGRFRLGGGRGPRAFKRERGAHLVPDGQEQTGAAPRRSRTVRG